MVQRRVDITARTALLSYLRHSEVAAANGAAAAIWSRARWDVAGRARIG